MPERTSDRTARGLPETLRRRDNAVVRPVDAKSEYVNPRADFQRLVRNGLLRPAGRGYYVIVPRRSIHRAWRPDLDAAALGIAQADYGVDAVALMGVSAARHHGAIPRALATAVVAIPAQRRPHAIDGAVVVFVTRNVATLDVERIRTEVTAGWVTTVEQTFVDIADRPTLAGVEPVQADEALAALGRRADWKRVDALARAQRKLTAVRSARERLGA